MVSLHFQISKQFLLISVVLEMKNQYIKSNSNRHTSNEFNSKSQLASRLKVIEFLKNQLYPTGEFDFFPSFIE